MYIRTIPKPSNTHFDLSQIIFFKIGVNPIWLLVKIWKPSESGKVTANKWRPLLEPLIFFSALSPVLFLNFLLNLMAHIFFSFPFLYCPASIELYSSEIISISLLTFLVIFHMVPLNLYLQTTTYSVIQNHLQRELHAKRLLSSSHWTSLLFFSQCFCPEIVCFRDSIHKQLVKNYVNPSASDFQ